MPAGSLSSVILMFICVSTLDFVGIGPMCKGILSSSAGSGANCADGSLGTGDGVRPRAPGEAKAVEYSLFHAGFCA